MKKLLCFVCAVLIAVLLTVSCASVKGTVDYSSPVYKGVRGEQPVYTYLVLDEEYRSPDGDYTIPYTENAVEVAKATGTIRFYFMVGERWLLDTGVDAAYLGDSTLVVFPDGQTMLIDGGRYQYASILVQNLRKLGIEKLDYVLLSHMHNDHYGVLWTSRGILANFPVDTLIWNGSYNTTESTMTGFNDAVAKYNIKLVRVEKGDSFDIGAVHFDIYGPVEYDLVGEQVPETKLNNSSIVAKMTYGDFKALFSGDLYVEGEWRVLEANEPGVLDVDLLKSNHHGQPTSSSTEWIEATTPRVVFSTTSPSDTLYMRFSKVGARVYSDYMDGYLRVVSDGYNCEVTAAIPRESTHYINFDKLVETRYPGSFPDR